MLYFASDYMEGAHPRILHKLLESNLEKSPGYGCDSYCRSAREKIRKACACEQAEVHFLVGGTQANAVVIRSLLRIYEGVLSAEAGHINVHEAGAIEAGGHKILPLPHRYGKIRAEDIESYMDAFHQDESREHMVKPGMVYISHPTEYGALYTARELEMLHEVCGRWHLPLFLDGARLGYGMMSRESDVDLRTIAHSCDVFSIGGTKVGALFGEAVVMTQPGLMEHFFTSIKQSGALLAKGRLLGIQFDTLFTDDLYYTISKHAITMAEKLKSVFEDKKYPFYFKSPTNQQFIILENERMKELAKNVSFSLWEKYDPEHTVVRFVTSWATEEKDIEALRSFL